MNSLFSRLAMFVAVVSAGFVLLTPDFADAKLSKGGGHGQIADRRRRLRRRRRRQRRAPPRRSRIVARRASERPPQAQWLPTPRVRGCSAR